jgi:polyisoprenoid-binding protein YceI
MKRSVFFSAAFLLLSSFHPVAPVSWTLDSVHSNLGFSVGHLGVSEITGSVQLKSATITAPDSTTLTGGTIMLEADMKTIDTDNDKRDAHLKTADFFDTAKFPVVSFQSTSFNRSSGEMYQLNGNLTLHGITKPVSMTVTVKTGLNPMNNKPLTGCRVTGKIKRSDFDISKATPEAILADEVTITANLEFTRE